VFIAFIQNKVQLTSFYSSANGLILPRLPVSAVTGVLHFTGSVVWCKTLTGLFCNFKILFFSFLRVFAVGLFQGWETCLPREHLKWPASELCFPSYNTTPRQNEIPW